MPASQFSVATLGPNALSTVVAGTAAASGTRTAGANPMTNTPPATSTGTATPTETATRTPQTSAEGTSLGKQEGGTTIFTDYQGGYSVASQPGWTAVRLNEQEFFDAWNQPAASDPKVQNFLNQIQHNDPKTYRLFGFNVLPDYLQDDYLTNFLISWDRNTNDSLETYMETLKKEVPKTLLNPKITSTSFGVTAAQIPIGVLEANSSVPLISGSTVQIFQRQIFFRAKTGMLFITFTTTVDRKDAMTPSFDWMTDQIRLLQ